MKTRIILLTIASLICAGISFATGNPDIMLAAVTPIFVPNWTFSDEEVRSFNEIIHEKIFAKPNPTDFHTIISNMVAGKKIGFAGRLGLIGKSGQAKCDPDTSTNQFEGSEKTWSPCDIADRLGLCWTDYEDSFIVYTQQKGVKRSDISQGDFINFLQDKLTDAALEMLFRVVWFNDTDAADVDASPAGQLTSGTDETYFNCYDGLWKQLFAIVVADANRKVTISKNAEATYALQAFNATDTTNKVAMGIFRDLIQKADMRLRGDAGKVIVCTQSLADQYENELEAQGIDESFKYIQPGISTLERKGVKIYAFSFWDRYIQTYFDNGTKYYLPHRAVMTTKEQLAIGVEDSNSFQQFDIWYDKKSKNVYIDLMFKNDAKVLEDYMVQVAY